MPVLSSTCRLVCSFKVGAEMIGLLDFRDFSKVLRVAVSSFDEDIGEASL